MAHDSRQKNMNEFVELLTEATTLEKNVAGLYTLFSRQFREDSTFWWNLALEETNHASLVRSMKRYFAEKLIDTPMELSDLDTRTLKKMNREITATTARFTENNYTRREAFAAACAIEKSAGEYHYQTTMKQVTDSTILKTLQKLNRDDIDHARRIETYMRDAGLS